MSQSLGDLINGVLTELHGQTQDLEQATFLKTSILSTDTSLSVDDASQLSRGLIEIDDELLWVSKIDTTNNLVTIAPFGRGFRGSTAAAHSANAMVTDNPRFPRSTISAKITETLHEIYPEIFVVKTDETNTVSPVITTYPVPSDCDTILSIRYETVGPSRLWQPVRRYTFNPKADTTAFPTGKTVDIGDAMFPGRPIRVTYSAAPPDFTNETTTLATLGLDESIGDVLTYGACYRLVAGKEIGRLQLTSIEQSDRAQFVPAGAATAGSKYYLALFQERLANERARLLQLYPTVTHLAS